MQKINDLFLNNSVKTLVLSTGCRFSSKDTCTFTLILQRAKVSKYHQSIKIRFSTQNIKISAVSTPIFARISPFFCIFRDLPEYIGENASKCQKMQKSFAPNFGNFQKISKKRSYFDTLAVFCTSVLCWIFAFSLWNLRKSAARKSRHEPRSNAEWPRGFLKRSRAGLRGCQLEFSERVWF